MKTFGLSLLFIIVGLSSAKAGLKEDQFGESLFFAKGNLVQDKYGDVKVVRCAPGKWMVYFDPNYCGQALAHGANACTELAMMIAGPFKATFARGNFYLKSLKNDSPMEILSIGNSNYSIVPMFGKKPMVLSQSKTMGRLEFANYCR